MNVNILEKTCVRDIRKYIVETPAVIDTRCPVDDMLLRIVDDPVTRHVYVTDPKGRLTGSVRLNVIVEHILPLVSRQNGTDREFVNFDYLAVTDIMETDPAFVEEDTPLSELVDYMKKEMVNELPVVDKDRKIIGEVNILEVITAYLKIKGKVKLK